jgi:hypothetical protein
MGGLICRAGVRSRRSIDGRRRRRNQDRVAFLYIRGARLVFVVGFAERPDRTSCAARVPRIRRAVQASAPVQPRAPAAADRRCAAIGGLLPSRLLPSRLLPSRLLNSRFLNDQVFLDHRRLLDWPDARRRELRRGCVGFLIRYRVLRRIVLLGCSVLLNSTLLNRALLNGTRAASRVTARRRGTCWAASTIGPQLAEQSTMQVL